MSTAPQPPTAASSTDEGPEELSPDFHPNGGAIAAFLAAAVSLLTLAVVQIASHVNDAFQKAVFSLGKAWIPGAEGIGPYSGKETLMLVVWIVAWGGLHNALAKRQLDTKTWFGVTLGIVLLAGILIWPPVWHLFE